MNHNKAAVVRLYDDVFTKGDVDAVDELVAPGCVDHEALPGATGDARTDLKEFVSMLRTAFPDLRAQVEDLVEEGDRVAARVTLHGTSTGSFMGMEPTGARIALPVIDILRFADGQVVEHWGASDSAVLTQQLQGQPA